MTIKELQEMEAVIEHALSLYPAGVCPRREESRRVVFAINEYFECKRKESA